MKSFIPWVGGKSKLLWLIHKLSPSRYSRFIDVFGGSGTVTLSRPIQQGCMEVYNDFNGDLTNLFCCVKNRTMALLLELGFLPLNTRDDFNVLYMWCRREPTERWPMPTGWIWSGISRSSVSRRRWTKAAAMRYPAGVESPIPRPRREL